MGQDIETTSFSDSDYRLFSEQLQRDLEALKIVIERPGFGAGPPTLGFELELNLVDERGLPRLCNDEVMATVNDPRVKLELARFNLELNGSPQPLRGRPFTAMGAELTELLQALQGAAAQHRARIAMVGILPTLRFEDLGPGALTDTARFHALTREMSRLRPGPHRLRIEGEDCLDLYWIDQMFEGAATSLQVHLRVPACDFADTYNAAQLATAPVLACAGNSPVFLSNRLWAETRIALFHQPVEESLWHCEPEWRPARVTFGHGWARHGALELFTENVSLHPPLLPVRCCDPDPVQLARAGQTPELCSLRLHHGTVWNWNRAIYDPIEDGHLRIEMRALPAGPSVADMEANAAFALGLTLGLSPQAEALISGLPFEHARRNFYAAARYGLDAELIWPGVPGPASSSSSSSPSSSSPAPTPVRAGELILRLIPVARAGLLKAGVEPEEVDSRLAIIAARTQNGQTGAAWQRKTLASLARDRSREEALAVMLERYLAHVDSGAPVHSWS